MISLSKIRVWLWYVEGESSSSNIIPAKFSVKMFFWALPGINNHIITIKMYTPGKPKNSN